MSCKIGTQCYIDSNGINFEEKTIPVILSDESKVIRFSWDEGIYHIILEHSDDAVDLRRKDILPILLQHDTNMLPLGIYENVRVEDKKLKATARFDAEDALAMEVFGKMSRGFMQTLSVGITIHSKELMEEDREKGNTYKATRWEITEASVVTVPAIPTAKVGMNDMGGSNTAVPVASGTKVAENSNTGANMEFNQANFNILLESRAHLNSNIELLNTRLSESATALEAARGELASANSALAEATATQEDMETRVMEAISVGVDGQTATAMLRAENAEMASKIANDFRASQGASAKADTDLKAEADAWAEFEK
jgi:HK97 family phage prohead protease